MKLSRKKRSILRRRARTLRNVIESRKVRLEREVQRGLRDARTLVAIPRKLARNSKTVFPPHPFGELEPW